MVISYHLTNNVSCKDFDKDDAIALLVCTLYRSKYKENLRSGDRHYIVTFET
ncbi:hypothetical protein [Iningainema tapete]|uniref:Uncharacterized protein n=1 Tax=Iningainema tapete BLCC-T55 TaxID=2748662 RepID=A0A8J6XCW0_9CYAN|nr:hypothetical protein [Iningainema tapete]MBD2770680.1 hypothetical protein [Iningainema tapete BLCC-T55]